MQIKDLNDNYTLVTDSQEIESIIDSLPVTLKTRKKWLDYYNGLLVGNTDNGYYESIYAVRTSVVYTTSKIHKLRFKV